MLFEDIPGSQYRLFNRFQRTEAIETEILIIFATY